MTVLNVGSTRRHKTISSAISRAINNDIILIDEGTYDEKLYISNKSLYFVANTLNPEHGKVIIRQIKTETYVLHYQNASSKFLVFEGLHFYWYPHPDDSTSYDHPINFQDCYGSTVTFNKSIIDTSYYWPIIFDSNSDELSRLNLYNCRINWNPTTTAAEQQFERTATKVIYDIKKCILPYMLEHVGSNYPKFPNGLQNNLANTANTTSDFTNISRMYNIIDDQYAYRNSCTVGQNYYINIELDEPTLVSRWFFYSDSGTNYNYSGKLNFQGSNDEVEWINANTSYERETSTYYREAFNTGFVQPYKYYRLEIEAPTSQIRITMFSMVQSEEIGGLFFDYAILPGKPGYGPAYGEYLTELPKQYYFKGEITDTILDNTLVDTVSWSSTDKASKVSLSNDDHRATVSTSDKYNEYGIRATVGRSTGKWYWEFKSSSNYGECRVGFGTMITELYASLGYDSYAWGYEYRTGYVYHGNSVILEGPACVNDDIIGIAYNAYNGKLWFSRNGVWLFNGNPVTEENPAVEVSAELFPMASLRSSDSMSSTVDLITETSNLNYSIPEGYSFYGTKVIWRVKALNANNNNLEGWDYSDPLDASYQVFTTYSGNHFLICEDASTDPVYNDLILGRFEPEEWAI